MDVLLLLVCLALIGACSSAFRPPAVPLVVNNPYMSIWSAADNLYDEFPMHWSGDIMGLTGKLSTTFLDSELIVDFVCRSHSD